MLRLNDPQGFDAGTSGMGNNRGKVMTRKNGKTTGDTTELEREVAELVSDIEARLSKLNDLTKRGASHAADEAVDLASSASSAASDFVTETMARIAERVRANFQNGARNISDEASQIGADTLRRIEDEIEHRPLLTLAIAAGIGFLAGIAGRRA
jgi:ElaB/YqjD/DUF883 family membrane-anchored ribosome-binding protein